MQVIRAWVCPSVPDGDPVFAGLLRDLASSGGVILEHADPLGATAVDCALLRVVPEGLDDACDTLEALRRRTPFVPSLAVARGLPPAAVERLLGHGACDFLGSSAEPAEVLLRMRRMLGTIDRAPSRGVDAVPASVAEALHARAQERWLVGSSAPFARQMQRLGKIAGCDAPVLILGETGTGKEICAQAVHYASARASGPWVPVNCGAIPSELLEDELFGHVRGAYTHAHAPRPGLVAEAEGGTLFLDEIDALPLAAQAKLLRFLQDKEYRPLGSSTPKRADVRVIAASNRQIERLVAQERFRQDLFFRLNVLTLTLPALRERRDDIAALALHFHEQVRREAGRPAGGLSPGALRRLVEHDWPGNVRELKHAIERAVLLGEGDVLQASDIELDGERAASEASEAESFRDAKARAVEAFERHFIERTLVASDGNIARAARLAQKNRRAFFELLRKHEIDVGRYRVS